MVATPIAVTQVSRSGTTSVAGTAGDAANGNSIQNDGKVWLEVANSAGTPHTLTVTVAQAGPDGNTVAGHVVTVPATGNVRTDVWPPSVYGTTMIVTVDNAAVSISPYRHT